jgi:hypothetical protein
VDDRGASGHAERKRHSQRRRGGYARLLTPAVTASAIATAVSVAASITAIVAERRASGIEKIKQRV